MHYMVLDLETSIKTEHKRKANFYYNEIVAIGIKKQNQNGDSWCWVPNHCTLPNLCPINTGPLILVGHNIKFDLLYLWKIEQTQLWLKQGGRIWDTQLAHYMLTGQQESYPALRDIAIRCYGCKEREKKMEIYWNKNIDTKDIPKELVLEDVNNDVLDTEQVMLRQVKQAKELGMYELIVLENEALLSIIEKEYNGIYINQSLMKENKKKIELELERVYKELEILFNNSECGIWKIINFNSSTQLSIFLFGGIIKIKIAKPLINAFGIEEKIKTGPNRGKVKTKMVVQDKIIKGLFRLSQEQEEIWKTKKKGIYSTDEKVLKILAESNSYIVSQISKLMLDLRNKEKLLRTYYEGFECLIYPDSCIRGSIDLVNNKTGRTNSSRPNLQNIPA